MIGAASRVFALLGNPVAHSLSPALHNAAFRALGLDAVYVALRCEAERVAPLMAALAEAGGGGNVTVPHKQRAATVLSAATAAPLVTANTFWSSDGRLTGCDTDQIGILDAWHGLGRPSGDWLVIGTGGSAAAAVLAARAAGAPVGIQSRTPDRAEIFSAWARAAGASVTTNGSYGLVINCTPLGLGDADPLPVAPDQIPAGAALDLVYRPGGTAWVRALLNQGIPAIDGRGVLVAQAGAAFSRWFPKEEAPIEVMNAVVRAALGPPPG